MASLSRKAPGSRAATVLLVAALFSRLPVFPSIAMTVLQHTHGGDSVAWGVHLTTIAGHLRYEGSWASHRPIMAFVVDAAHALLLLLVGSVVAIGVQALSRRLPRRRRVALERAVRRATVWAYGFFAILVALKTLLSRGMVRGPRPLLLTLVGFLLLAVLAFAVRGRAVSWPRMALRTTATLVLGVPLIVSLLALFALVDGRHLAHVPAAWAGGITVFAVVAKLGAWAQRRFARSTLR